jgi:hypothetical protein
MFFKIFLFHVCESQELVLDVLAGDIGFVDIPVVEVRYATEVSVGEFGDADTDFVVFLIDGDGVVEIGVVVSGVEDDTVDGGCTFVVDIVVALRGSELHALEGREQIGLDVLQELLVEVSDDVHELRIFFGHVGLLRFLEPCGACR